MAQGQDGWPYRVKHVSSGQGGGPRGTVRDGRGGLRTAGNSGGRPGMVRDGLCFRRVKAS